MPQFSKVLGTKIRQLRKARSLTQAELGEKIQMSQGYIGEIERGLINISLETIEKIVTALDITLFELFDFRNLQINDQSLQKETIIELHKKILLGRNLEEVKLIHKIALDILNTMDNRK